MNVVNSSTQYGSVAKFFHWITALGIFGMVPVGFLMHDIADKAMKGQVYNMHKLTGLTILTLMGFRVMWAIVNPKPVLPANTAAWERFTEKMVHGLLYLMLIIMPISGWIMSTASGHSPHLGDLILHLPGIDKYKPTAEIAAGIHKTTALILIGFVSLHILAAFKHHFVDRDNVLRRMLPFKRL